MLIFLLASTAAPPSLGADYEANRDSIDFNIVRESLCRSAKLILRNTSDTQAPRPELSLADSDTFSLSIKEKRCPENIAADKTCQIYIRFCPPWLGNFQTVLHINGSQQVTLTGEGILGKF